MVVNCCCVTKLPVQKRSISAVWVFLVRLQEYGIVRGITATSAAIRPHTCVGDVLIPIVQNMPQKHIFKWMNLTKSGGVWPERD